MKKIDVLRWGVKHIAGNHHFSGDCYTDQDGRTILYTGSNVPSTADMRMLAEDLGVREFCHTRGHAVRIVLGKGWVDTVGQEEFVPADGMMMWKRRAVELGGHLGYMAEEYDPFYERSGCFYEHFDDIKEARKVCDDMCRSMHNGNLYSVWEVGMDENTEVYCCQYSSKSGQVVDVTEQELARQAELRRQWEEIMDKTKRTYIEH